MTQVAWNRDDREFYFDNDDGFRQLPDLAAQTLSVRLMSPNTMPQRSWQMVADRLGYSAVEIDAFSVDTCCSGRVPAYKMLKDWSSRNGSKLRVLRQTLVSLGRLDIVTLLDELRKHKFSLYVCFKRVAPSQTTYVDVAVEGRKCLLSSLLETLEDQCTSTTPLLYFKLETDRMTWRTESHQFQGQQVDVNVKTIPQGVNQTRTPVGRHTWLIDDKTVLVDKRTLPGMVQQMSVRRSADDQLHSSAESGSLSETTTSAADNDQQSSMKYPTLDLRSTGEETQTAQRRVSDDCDQSPVQCSERDGQSAAAAADNDPVSDGLDETVRAELRTTTGYHEHVGNHSSLIKRALHSVSATNGAYIVRSFTDDRTGQLVVALSLICDRRIRHFYIHRRHDLSGAAAEPVVYYLFNNGFNAPSIQSLLDHYTQHPIVDQSGAPHIQLSMPVPIR